MLLGLYAFNSASMPWVPVTHPNFGAKGDGTTDDSDAIQAAIDSLPVEGGIIFFPRGTYYLASALSFTSKPNIVFLGAGSAGWGGNADNAGTSRLITDQAIWLFDIGPASGSAIPGGPHFAGLSFEDRSASSIALGAIRIKHCQHVQVQDIAIANFKTGYGIYFDGTGGSLDAVQYGSLKDVKCRKVYKGISVQGGSMQFVVEGGHFTAPDSPNYTGSIGIEIAAGPNARADTWKIINPSLESYETGIALRGTIGVRIAARIENTDVTSKYDATGVLIEGTADFNALANVVSECSINGAGTGIQVGTLAYETEIYANSVIDIGSGGRYAVDSSVSDRTIIRGTNLFGAGAGSGGVRIGTGGYQEGACQTGSMCHRVDGASPGVPALYVCENSEWVAK